MTIKICGPRLLVKQDNIEESDPTFKAAKKAGIALPDESKQVRMEQAAQVYGTLVQIGSRCWYAPVGDGTPWAKVGDRVQYAKHSGAWTEDPETKERFTILNDEDLIAVITGTEPGSEGETDE